MNQALDLRGVARELFDAALDSVDACRAVRRAVRLEDSCLTIRDTSINLDRPQHAIYAVAIGKAALPMASALDEVLKERLTEGLVVSQALPESNLTFFRSPEKLSTKWRQCKGGHPLPTSASLTAAQFTFDLLKRANDERALVIFLISGGGSAMIEWPSDEQITLTDLRDANRLLIKCGANITEINSVRRAFSEIKGGGLAARAPFADQITLIISDTPIGQGSIVASGPTFDPPLHAPDAADVIARYKLVKDLPVSIMRAVTRSPHQFQRVTHSQLRDHYVLLDSGSALEATLDEARRRGFAAEYTNDILDQPISEGCGLMLSRLSELRSRAETENRVVCLISGGEFSCPIQGDGIGGRNAETALRCAIELDIGTLRGTTDYNMTRVAVLSAGTDGIDGNSPAAGAVASNDTLERARIMGLNPVDYLERSDAFSFFNALGDTIMTGPTGTNVRDLRIMLAS